MITAGIYGTIAVDILYVTLPSKFNKTDIHATVVRPLVFDVTLWEDYIVTRGSRGQVE